MVKFGTRCAFGDKHDYLASLTCACGAPVCRAHLYLHECKAGKKGRTA